MFRRCRDAYVGPPDARWLEIVVHLLGQPSLTLVDPWLRTRSPLHFRLFGVSYNGSDRTSRDGPGGLAQALGAAHHGLVRSVRSPAFVRLGLVTGADPQQFAAAGDQVAVFEIEERPDTSNPH